MRAGSHDNPVTPRGYKRKAKSRLRADRSPVYLPTSSLNKLEAAQWLKAR